MSLQLKLRGALVALGLVFTFSAVAFAQQPVPPQQDGARRPMHEGKGRGPGKRGNGAMRLLRELNLTDAQRAQIRAIQERAMAATKTQHDALKSLRENNEGPLTGENLTRAQTLRAEIEQVMKAAHQETISLLTQEQRTQLEQLKQERKGRRGERRGPGHGMGPGAGPGPGPNQPTQDQ